MSYQQILGQLFLDPIKLKEGKVKCPACGRACKGWGYNLNKKMVMMGMRILKYCQEYNTDLFNSRELFGEESLFHQFSKLKCFGIIERTKNECIWKLTWRGKRFLFGKGKLDKKVWYFDDYLFDKDGEIYVWQADTDWKTTYFDFLQDYILVPYKTQLKLT